MSYVKEKHGAVTVYRVQPILTDAQADKIANTRLNPSQIKLIIDDDSDVYDETGALLLKFRKNVLSSPKITAFYDNVEKFAKHTTSNRGSATGSTKKNVSSNPKVMTNIFGYFDKWSPMQKYKFTQRNKKPSIEVRECRFNVDYPEEYKRTIPLIQQIDQLYKKYTPAFYAKQHNKAKQTFFKIGSTSFTTVTTNVNYQTTVHKDAGDDIEGFGNLAVIEKGEYTGGETCFPKYGVGVNVRTGDLLLMNVHQWHANLPIHLKTPDAIRLSIVCYLRKGVWSKTKNLPKSFMVKHNKTVKNLSRRKH